VVVEKFMSTRDAAAAPILTSACNITFTGARAPAESRHVIIVENRYVRSTFKEQRLIPELR
jgi:hypothetical protein